MRPNKPDLRRLEHYGDSAFDKVEFVADHYPELQKMYMDIMEHLKLPQVEVSTGGEGVKWVTHKIELTYVDMLMSENTLLENGLGYSSVEEAIKLIPYRSCIANKGEHYGGSGELVSTVPIQNNNIKPVYMGTNSDGKHIFRYAIENSFNYAYGDEYTFYIKKANRGDYANLPTGYMSTVFINDYYNMSYTYEVRCSRYNSYTPLSLNYISSISSEDGSNPYYVFTEKYIDDSEAE